MTLRKFCSEIEGLKRHSVNVETSPKAFWSILRWQKIHLEPQLFRRIFRAPKAPVRAANGRYKGNSGTWVTRRWQNSGFNIIWVPGGTWNLSAASSETFLTLCFAGISTVSAFRGWLRVCGAWWSRAGVGCMRGRTPSQQRGLAC